MLNWRSNTKIPPFARFLIVGAICFAVNLGVIYGVTELWRWHYLIGVSLSILVANTLGFALNRGWTFAAQRAAFWRELGRYYLVSLGAFATNFAAMAILVSGLGLAPLPASAAVAVAMIIANFLIHKNWSFAAR